jgi:SHS2 domain-containing protein
VPYSFEEHTSEVRIRVEAARLEELFAEAARALADLMGRPSPERNDRADPETVELRARDRDALLARWLDELIYRTERSGRIFADVHVERVEGERLIAQVRGSEIAEPRTPVKAATLHGLCIRAEGGRFTVEVVLDV